MIPKIIHYCWFGGRPLPKSAIKCINSWRKYFPDYKIVLWCEVVKNDNVNCNSIGEIHGKPILNYAENADEVRYYDVYKIRYTREAYEAKKYAFVSDYVRFDILYHEGGIYFDTDVEVLKSFDDIISQGPFMGREAGAYMVQYGLPYGLSVAPGLGLGAESNMPIYKDFIEAYQNYSFLNIDGTLNTKTVVSYITEILLQQGLSDKNDEIIQVAGLNIYPADYFCPMDHTKGKLVTITNRTHSIHQYDATWGDKRSLHHYLSVIKNWAMRTFGPERIQKLVNLTNKA